MKRNKTFWEERFIPLHESFFAAGESQVSKLEKEYAKAVMIIDREISRWYSRLAKNNKITLLGANKLLKDNELQEFHWTLEDYISYGRANSLNQKWIKELENASAKVHISYLDEMKIHIRQQAERVTAYRSKTLKADLSQLFIESYDKTIFELQKETHINTFKSLSSDTVDSILMKPWKGNESFVRKIASDRIIFNESLDAALVRAVIRNASLNQIIEILSDEFRINKNAGKRMIGWERAHFIGDSQILAYKEMQIDKYMITAILDNATTQICRDMDGTIVEIKYYEPYVTAPPFHYNCRSFIVPHNT